MAGRAAICLAVGVAFALFWFFLFRSYNRGQGKRVLGWIESALEGSGEIAAVKWLGSASFVVRLRLETGLLHQPALTVNLPPRQMPLRWLRHWWRREPATITWQANLDVPPSFNLQVGRHRWSGRSRRGWFANREQWTLQPVTSLILTSRRSWPREIASLMSALLSSRDCVLLSLAFSRSSPHFSAVFPLAGLSPENRGAVIFGTLRELAAGASASRQ
jgi:hypothetical protein